MAKLGNSEFPEVGLSESVELARRIHDELGGEVRREGLAIVLGMSPNGGAYGARIGALRMWGLATGRSLLRLTNDGLDAASVELTIEKSDVVRKLAASIPLFNELHQRIGTNNVDQNVLTALLREITGAETTEVLRRVGMVERIYRGIRPLFDAPHVATDAERSDALGSDVQARNGQTASQDPLPPDWMEFRYADGAMRMKETVENLDVLISIAEARRRRLLHSQRDEAHRRPRFTR